MNKIVTLNESSLVQPDRLPIAFAHMRRRLPPEPMPDQEKRSRQACTAIRMDARFRHRNDHRCRPAVAHRRISVPQRRRIG